MRAPGLRHEEGFPSRILTLYRVHQTKRMGGVNHRVVESRGNQEWWVGSALHEMERRVTFEPLSLGTIRRVAQLCYPRPARIELVE